MGCDIHLHIEVKVAGEWHQYAQPHLSRSYRMFHRMAGVRGPFDGVEPFAPPRGLPGDISLLTKLDAGEWDGDAHSHSWLSADELVLLDDAYGALCPDDYAGLEGWLGTYFYGNGFAGFRKYPEGNPAFVEDLRFVFWFDN